MREFDIVVRSFRQVQAFVTLAMGKKFEIEVGNDRQQINGKDIVGMFSLDYTRPITVRMECSEEEYLQFRQEAARLPV